MKVQGELIKRYNGGKPRADFSIMIVVGVIFLIISFCIYGSSELRWFIGETAHGLLVVLTVIAGCIFIAGSFVVGAKSSKCKQSYLEVYTDGVILFPGEGERFEATYDKLLSPRFGNNSNIILTNVFGITSRLPYVDTKTGMEICQRIQENIDLCKK